MRKILCIDDDPTYTSLYQAILEQRGYTVVVADNAAKGLALAESEAPSLILLDVMMPESGGFRDGFDLLERFRKSDFSKTTPVVMISSIGGPDDERHGLELGANAYIGKNDLTPGGLAQRIEDLLK